MARLRWWELANWTTIMSVLRASERGDPATNCLLGRRVLVFVRCRSSYRCREVCNALHEMSDTRRCVNSKSHTGS
ncbi:uncharacterized protein LY79DRAFT_543864 [Colletotrichum navitas]|uniref:Uncharacterized protein n=1 Tax=Colletotrichum navitas TaxID=681940 RepID=A0AAD8V718_9PEZI|nr:uncharacterized protein LY79DRAFT_543864 [Colletotrichum navitas]KAK1596672.1 hypothetical protein LY79DRAFT_543864 [Colletotrichum navitas]